MSAITGAVRGAEQFLGLTEEFEGSLKDRQSCSSSADIMLLNNCWKATT